MLPERKLVDYSMRASSLNVGARIFKYVCIIFKAMRRMNLVFRVIELMVYSAEAQLYRPITSTSGNFQV